VHALFTGWACGFGCGHRASPIRGDAELHLHGCGPGSKLRELGEFVACSSEAEVQTVDFAEPAFTVGFSDAGGEVVADVDQPLALDRVGS